MRDAATTLVTEDSRPAGRDHLARAGAATVPSDGTDGHALLDALVRIGGDTDAAWLRRLTGLLEPPAMLAGIEHAAPADRDLVRALRIATGLLRRADDQVGGGVRDAVECHLTVSRRLLAVQPPGPDQRDLAKVVGDTAQLAGWLAFDAGDNECAENHYRTGLRAAHLAGDHLLAAYLMAHTAHLLANLRETSEALAATTIIRRLTARQTTPATQAYAASVEADIHARRGDREQALRALDRAERWLGRIVPSKEPSWLYYFDRAELLGWRGEVGMRLNLPLLAAEALQERLTLLSPALPRERAFATADLACAYVQQRRLDDGVALAIQALDTARAIGSTRAVERVVGIRRRLELHTTARCVRHLDESLRGDRKTA